MSDACASIVFDDASASFTQNGLSAPETPTYSYSYTDNITYPTAALNTVGNSVSILYNTISPAVLVGSNSYFNCSDIALDSMNCIYQNFPDISGNMAFIGNTNWTFEYTSAGGSDASGNQTPYVYICTPTICPGGLDGCIIAKNPITYNYYSDTYVTLEGIAADDSDAGTFFVEVSIINNINNTYTMNFYLGTSLESTWTYSSSNNSTISYYFIPGSENFSVSYYAAYPLLALGIMAMLADCINGTYTTNGISVGIMCTQQSLYTSLGY